MKKFKLVSLVLVLSFTVIGIVFAQTNKPPEWYLKAYQELYKDKDITDIIVGTGQATGNSASLTEKTAIAAARAEVASQMASMIENALFDFEEESGIVGDDIQTVQSRNNILKAITAMKLTYAKTVQKGVSDDGRTYYIAVEVNEARAIKDAIKAVETAAKKESAVYANLRAAEVEEKLKEQIDAMQENAQ